MQLIARQPMLPLALFPLEAPTAILLFLGILAVGIALGAVIAHAIHNSRAAKDLNSAESRAKTVVDEAEKEAEQLKKSALIEAKEEILRQKAESDREIKERRSELQKSEKRLSQKEDTLDRKIEQNDKKSDTLDKKIKEADAKRAQIEEIIQTHLERLEEIAGLTVEQAKEELIKRVETECKHDIAQRIIDLEEEYRSTADEKAKNILSLAIQRCAADHVADVTVTSVAIPNEEMKGRIIGREGRNIQKLETLTGVDLVVDDTPEAITISGFDPVRREIARITLEKLVSDGRIHPTRIEEMVEKARKEVEISVKQAGERATFETGVHGLHPDLVRMLGRLKYRTSYGQNVLRHSIEVALLAGMIADELGVDSVVAKRAGLLHDIGKAFPHDMEGTHVELGVNTLKKYKENKDVIHAVEAHHNDVEPKTIVAIIVQAADAISAARPGARREDLENYIKRLQKLEEIAESFEGVDKAYAIQAGREVRVMVKPELVNDEGMVIIAREMVAKIKEEMRFPGQIKVNLIRESRAVDFAK